MEREDLGNVVMLASPVLMVAAWLPILFATRSPIVSALIAVGSVVGLGFWLMRSRTTTI